MSEKYIEPEMEVIDVSEGDVVCASGDNLPDTGKDMG